MEKAFLTLINKFFQQHPNKKVDTIFFGGGTPSLAKPQIFENIIKQISKFSDLKNVEISMEANPTSIETNKLRDFHNAGVNRLSIGIQSFHPIDLKFLGREHSAEDAIKAIEISKSLFKEVSVDLIFGTPNHFDSKIWNYTLDQALSLDLKHISLYQLSIENGTKLAKDKSLKIPSQDDTYDLFTETIEKCEAKGLLQYEVSNFAKSGHECRHNVNYWKCNDYIGFGPGAHSRVTDLNGIRRGLVQIMEPREWIHNVAIENGDGNVKNYELQESDRISELLLMGLRNLKDGISIEQVKSHTKGKNFAQIMDMKKVDLLVKNDLLFFDGSVMNITRKGMYVLNLVLKELV